MSQFEVSICNDMIRHVAPNGPNYRTTAQPGKYIFSARTTSTVWGCGCWEWDADPHAIIIPAIWPKNRYFSRPSICTTTNLHQPNIVMLLELSSFMYREVHWLSCCISWEQMDERSATSVLPIKDQYYNTELSASGGTRIERTLERNS